jgi:hypothetical protein
MLGRWQAHDDRQSGRAAPSAQLSFHGGAPLPDRPKAAVQVIHGKPSLVAWRGELNGLTYKIIHIGKDRLYAGGLLEDCLKIA